MTGSSPDDGLFIEIGGRRLEYRWFSRNQRAAPLVFLHEGLGSIDLWRSFPADVVRMSGHPGLAYSRHGNGWSQPLEQRRDPDYMQHEALQVLPTLIHQLVEEPPILIGHSDGASIATIYAGAGHEVAGMILIAPHVFVEDRTIESIGALRAAFDGSEMAEKMAKYHSRPESTFRGWSDIWLDDRFRDWNIESYLEAIDCPILLIQSENDEYGTIRQLDSIQRQARGPVQRLVVDGYNHAPHLEHPEVVTPATVQFISGLSDNSS